MTGRWEIVAENNQAVAQLQMLGFQSYPALTRKKSKVENTTRETLDAKDASSLSTEYTLQQKGYCLDMSPFPRSLPSSHQQ